MARARARARLRRAARRSTSRPSSRRVAGPRRPQDRVPLPLAGNFRDELPDGSSASAPSGGRRRGRHVEEASASPSRPRRAVLLDDERPAGRPAGPDAVPDADRLRRSRRGRRPDARRSARARWRSPRSRRARTPRTRRSWSAPDCSPGTPSRAGCASRRRSRRRSPRARRRSPAYLAGRRPDGRRSSSSASPWPATAARPASATPARSTSRSPKAIEEQRPGRRPRSSRATATSRAGSIPLARASYLASPPLVVAFALAGRVDIDLTTRAARASATTASPVFLADVWPSPDEIRSVIRDVDRPGAVPRRRTRRVFEGDDRWRALPIPDGDRGTPGTRARPTSPGRRSSRA